MSSPCAHWSFNCFDFEWEELETLVVEMFDNLDLLDHFGVENQKFELWVSKVKENYFPSNDVPYHNWRHAFDCMQYCFLLFKKSNVEERLTKLDMFALLLACLCHDMRHPGLNNAYLVRTCSQLAARANNESVLEKMHAEEALALLDSSDTNVLSTLSPADAAYARNLIYTCILGTDLALHFTWIVRMSDHLSSIDRPLSVDYDLDRQFVCVYLVKIADIGITTRPYPLNARWNDLLQEEFFRQGEKEKERGLPVSPHSDRDDCDLFKQRSGFIDNLALPLFQSLVNALPELAFLLYRLDHTRMLLVSHLVDKEMYSPKRAVPSVPSVTASQSRRASGVASMLHLANPSHTMQLFASYLPRSVLLYCHKHPVRLRPEIVSSHGVVAYIDIEGFAQLVEEQAARQSGTDGGSGFLLVGDELGEAIGSMLQKIIKHGGDIDQFAGNGVIVVWLCDSDDDDALAALLVHAVRVCLKCASKFRSSRTANGDPGLLNVSVAAGEISKVFCGGVGGLWQHLLLGNALSDALSVEKVDGGGLVCHRSSWALISRRFRGEKLLSKNVNVLGLDVLPAVRGPRHVEIPLTEDHESSLRSFIPPVVSQRVHLDQLESTLWCTQTITASVMHISIVFVYSQNALAILEEAVRFVQSTVQAFKGTLDRLMYGNNRIRFKVIFGLLGQEYAGSTSIEHRALSAALEINKELVALDTQPQIGIVTGPLQCSNMGATNRRFYVTVGRIVVRALRLMDLADESIVVDEATYSATSAWFSFMPLPATRLPGSDKPVALYSISAATSDKDSSLSYFNLGLLGNELTGSRLTSLFEQFVEDDESCPIVVLQGPAGVTKSGLLLEAVAASSTQAAPLAPIHMLARPQQQRIPYSPFRSLFQRLFSLLCGCGSSAERGTPTRASADGYTSCGLFSPPTSHITPVLSGSALHLHSPKSPSPSSPSLLLKMNSQRLDSPSLTRADSFRDRTESFNSPGGRSQGSTSTKTRCTMCCESWWRQERVQESLPRSSLDYAACVNSVLGTTFPETAALTALSLVERAQTTRELLLSLLRSFFIHLKSPLIHPVLIFENANLLDEASWLLLTELCQEEAQMHAFIALTLQTGDDCAPLTEPQNDFVQRAVVIDIPMLTRASTKLLLQSVSTSFAEDSVDYFYKCSGGNTLCCVELVNHLMDKPIPPSSQAVATTTKDVITARMMGLPARLSTLVKVASVLGLDFEQTVLHDIYPVAASKPLIKSDLATLHIMGIVAPVAMPGSKSVYRYRFTHNLHQEVAYSMVPLASKVALHRSVARNLEHREASRFLADLSYHWSAVMSDGANVTPDDAAKTTACLLSAADDACQHNMLDDSVSYLLEARACYALCSSFPDHDIMELSILLRLVSLSHIVSIPQIAELLERAVVVASSMESHLRREAIAQSSATAFLDQALLALARKTSGVLSGRLASLFFDLLPNVQFSLQVCVLVKQFFDGEYASFLLFFEAEEHEHFASVAKDFLCLAHLVNGDLRRSDMMGDCGVPGLSPVAAHRSALDRCAFRLAIGEAESVTAVLGLLRQRSPSAPADRPSLCACLLDMLCCALHVLHPEIAARSGWGASRGEQVELRLFVEKRHSVDAMGGVGAFCQLWNVLEAQCALAAGDTQLCGAALRRWWQNAPLHGRGLVSEVLSCQAQLVLHGTPCTLAQVDGARANAQMAVAIASRSGALLLEVRALSTLVGVLTRHPALGSCRTLHDALTRVSALCDIVVSEAIASVPAAVAYAQSLVRALLLTQCACDSGAGGAVALCVACLQSLLL